jgi:Flp pilus assembly protein TadG
MKGFPMLRSRAQRGNTILEFALSFALLFGVFAGIFRFGYAYYAYNVLVNSVRDGARYAANLPYSSTTSTPDSTYLAKVRNMVVYGNPAPAQNTVPVLSGLSTANVAVAMTSGNSGGITPPKAVTVSITGFSLYAVFTTFNLSGHPYCMFPYTGILTPPST